MRWRTAGGGGWSTAIRYGVSAGTYASSGGPDHVDEIGPFTPLPAGL